LGIEVDWVAAGIVGPVQSRGGGSCPATWAFLSTDTLWSFAKKKNQTVSLSEQQLVDCSTSYGNKGCQSGAPQYAFNYVKDNGIASSSEYPWVGSQQGCKMKGGSFKIAGSVTTSGCPDLEKGLSVMPVVVAVDATNWSTYKSGILSNCSNRINHVAMLVGASTSGAFWRIKNWWGATWGESGYIRLAPGNTCGVCTAGVYPN
jgi:C1A family cysteine protease